jgi:ABC-type oligopeptide transport system substrate-binding subunit
MPILDNDEKLMFEAIDSIIQRGVLGYEKFEDDTQIVYSFSHQRARQQRAALALYERQVRNALKMAMNLKRLADKINRDGSMSMSFVKALPANTGATVEMFEGEPKEDWRKEFDETGTNTSATIGTDS